MMKSLNPLQIDFLGIKLYINLDIEIITFVALDLKIYNLILIFMGKFVDVFYNIITIILNNLHILADIIIGDIFESTIRLCMY